MRTTGLDRLTLAERVNDLIQVGLATKDLETRSVSATRAAAGLLDLVDRAKASLVESMGAEMPAWNDEVEGGEGV